MPAKKTAKKKYTKRSPYWERLKANKAAVDVKKGNVPAESKMGKEVSARHLGITKIIPVVKDVAVGEDITLKECADSLIRWMIRTKPSLKTLQTSLIAMIATKGMMIAETPRDFIYLKQMINLLSMDNRTFLKIRSKATLDDIIEEDND